MAIQTPRAFYFLLVISFCIGVFVLSLGLSINRWNTFSGQTSQANEEMVDFGDVKGHSTATHERTTKSNPGATLKSYPTRCSTCGAETPMPVLYRKSFKKYPEWEFEDIYNQDAPPRQSTCAQSLRNSMEDEGFKKAFLPNIRLFMHKINMSEWNRLSHFNSPFGFMQFNYDDVMAAVQLIPKPKEPLLLPKTGSDRCLRCAVVGTGGILNGSKMGKEIDAHDYVFRMNGAIIKGYEEDVGNRTSVYVHTSHSITTSLYLLRKYGYTSAPNDEGIKYVLIPEGMRDFIWLEALFKRKRITSGQRKNTRPETYYGGQYNETRFYVLHQDFLRYVRNRFLKSPHLNSSYWDIVRPTNGAFTLFLALQTCDTVSAYGFMTEDYKKYSNYYVEHVKTKVIFYANHDYDLEKNLWKKLHNSKILKLYQRTETGTEAPSMTPMH